MHFTFVLAEQSLFVFCSLLAHVTACSLNDCYDGVVVHCYGGSKRVKLQLNFISVATMRIMTFIRNEHLIDIDCTFSGPWFPPSQWLQLARVMNKLGNHHNEFLINLCVKVMWNIKIFIEKKTFEFSSQIKFGMKKFIKFGMSDISIQPNRIGSPARYKIIKLYFYQHKLCNLFRARR